MKGDHGMGERRCINERSEEEDIDFSNHKNVMWIRKHLPDS